MLGCFCSQVYNLPETVRESDVEKLSFAVQLADGFYATSQVRPHSRWECLCTGPSCTSLLDIHAQCSLVCNHPEYVPDGARPMRARGGSAHGLSCTAWQR